MLKPGTLMILQSEQRNFFGGQVSVYVYNEKTNMTDTVESETFVIYLGPCSLSRDWLKILIGDQIRYVHKNVAHKVAR